jgi:hypothetical protein
MAYLDLLSVARGIQSSYNAKNLNDFLSKGGVIGYNQAGEGTRYVSNDAPGRAGTILIDPTHPGLMSAKFGGELQATRDLIVHELGHFVYEGQDKAMFPAATVSVEARMSFCFERETEASMYAFQVAQELKAQGIRAEVPGTSAIPDLYKLIETNFSGSHEAAWSAVTSAWKSDPQYAAYCARYFGKVNAYIPPDGVAPTPSADGDGTDATGPAGSHGNGAGSGGGGSGSVPSFPTSPPSPIGGGYWNPVPPAPTPGPVIEMLPSNVAAEVHTFHAGLIGVNTLPSY